MKNLQQEINCLSEWLSSLGELDRNNFNMLLNLKDPEKLVAKMPSGKYQDMAIRALILKRTADAEREDARRLKKRKKRARPN